MAVVVMKKTMVVAAFLVVAGILFSGHMVTAGGPECEKGWLGKLIGECALYIKKGGPRIPPSKGCCDGVKRAKTECLCGKLPPELGKFISLDKFLYVLDFCGKPLKPEPACGKDKVPPPPPQA